MLHPFVCLQYVHHSIDQYRLAFIIFVYVDGQLWVEVIKNLTANEQLVAEFHEPNSPTTSSAKEAVVDDLKVTNNNPKDTAASTIGTNVDTLSKTQSNMPGVLLILVCPIVICVIP